MAATVNFDLPRIFTGSAETQLKDMQRYVYQLVEKLNYAMDVINSPEAEAEYVREAVAAGAAPSDTEAQGVFDEIKSLIITSADIVNAYYEQIKTRLSGVYVAQSDFGEFSEQTEAAIEATNTALTQTYTMIEELTAALDGVQSTQSGTNAWIRSGLLDNTVSPPVYGVEVGQVTNVDGEEVFNKYARFTASGIYFYAPGSDDPIASLSGSMLIVNNIRVLSRLTIGGYILDSANGLSFKWGGR